MAGQYQISFAHSAVSDLEDVLAFYKEQKIPQVGERLVKKIIQEIELLSEEPDMGRMVPEFGLKDQAANQVRIESSGMDEGIYYCECLYFLVMLQIF